MILHVHVDSAFEVPVAHVKVRFGFGRGSACGKEVESSRETVGLGRKN